MRRPIVYAIVTLDAKIKLMRQGYRLTKINAALDLIPERDLPIIIDSLIPDQTIVPGDIDETATTQAIGDGQIIQLIRDFFKSDLGKLVLELFMNFLKDLMDSN